jgi:hypothetical protein
MSQRLFPLIGTAVLTATLSLTPALHAGASNKSGNPFGNGTFFNTSGTFSAVVRGENLSGTILFSTGVNTNGSSGSSGGGQNITNSGFGISGNSPGSSVIVYEGYTYQGNAAGMWNPANNGVNGQFWGSQVLAGTNGFVTGPEIYNTNIAVQPYPYLDTNDNNWYSTNIPTRFSPYPLTFITNVIYTNVYVNGNITNYVSEIQTITNVVYIEPVGTNSYQSSVSINGSFDGTSQNQYPNQTFSAYGSATLLSLLPPSTNNAQEGTVPATVKTNTMEISVQGVRVSDSYSTFSTVSNAVPYSVVTYSPTNASSWFSH